MRRTRLSLAALAVASSVLLGLPTVALAAPGAGETSSPAGVTGSPSAAPAATAEVPGTSAPATTSAPVESSAPAESPATVESSAPAPTSAPAPEASVAALPAADIPVQIIGMNDFHGRISQTTGNDSQLLTGPGPDGAYGTADDLKVVVGGAANVKSTVDSIRGSFTGAGGAPEGSLFVGAGDLISASPFNSSVFKDEPTIEVLNALGLDASSVGNHEFDRGTEELRRISAATDGLYSDDVSACEGVTPGVDGCFPDSTGAPFHGTDFEYLAANVVMKDTGAPALPPFEVFDVGGGKQVALIGVVTDTTPTIVSPNGIADVDFIDEATAVNRWVPTIQAMGIQAIGVLVHEGGEAGAAAPPTAAYNGCSGVQGPILDINARTSAAVDFIVSAHSHQAYNCLLADPSGQQRLVTQAGYYGRLLTDIRLGLNPLTGDVDRAGTYSATNVPVTRDAADPTVAAIVKYWDDKSKVAGDAVVGEATADILRSGAVSTNAPRDVESSLGNLVAQAQLEAMQQGQYGSPVVAFMNPGGLRTDLTAGPVTYSELYNIQPFGNTVNAVTLTGADIRQVLEQQYPSSARASTLILGTSAGLSYAVDPARPAGDRVDPCSIVLNGTVVDPAASYRVAMNSFLATGGDAFTAFTQGVDPVTGPVDVDTAVAYFKAHSPVSPPAADHAKRTTERLTCGGGGTGGDVPPPPVQQPAPQPAPEPAPQPAPQPAPPVVQPVVHPRPVASDRDELAYTGSPIGEMLVFGGALLAAGLALTAAGYRRRRGLAD